MSNFFSYTTFMNLCLFEKQMQEISVPPPGTHVLSGCTSMFPTIWRIFDFRQRIRNVSNSLYSLIGFFEFTLPVLWFFKASKFFTYCMLIIVTTMTYNPRFDFCYAETSHLCSPCKKTLEKWLLFCYASKHLIIWVFNVFSKVIVECWYVHITVGFLSYYLSILKFFTMTPVKRAFL